MMQSAAFTSSLQSSFLGSGRPFVSPRQKARAGARTLILLTDALEGMVIMSSYSWTAYSN